MNLSIALVLSSSVLISATSSATVSVSAPTTLTATQDVAPLSGKVGKLVKGINGNLDAFEKLIADPGSDAKETWTRASALLDLAKEDHAKISSLYSSRFSPTHPDWVKVSTRLTKAKSDGDAFKARHVSGKKDKPKVDDKKPVAGTAPTKKLTGGLAYALKNASQSLDSFDRTLARAGNDKLGAWKAAKGELTEAGEALDKGERDHAGKFDTAHPQWAAMRARVETSGAALKSFYDAEVDGGGSSDDGSKKTGFEDAQSVVAASNPNRKSVDRAVWLILMETEKVRKLHGSEAMTSDVASSAGRAVDQAKRLHERLRASYGSVINKDSDQYLALCSEIETSERLASEMPALVKSYTAALEKREAEEKRAAEEAKRLTDAEQKARVESVQRARRQGARFPESHFSDAKLEKIANAAIAAEYAKWDVMRLQVTGPFKVRSEARIVKDVIEYGTYRYLLVEVAMRRKDGQAEVYSLKLRNTRQPDRSWGPLEVSGTFADSFRMLAENVGK